MKADPEMVSILCAGLESMEYVQTASRGDWKRFGKFRFWDRNGGGDAYYVLPDGTLWYSILRVTEPEIEISSQPFYSRVFEAGCKAVGAKPPKVNADDVLDELLGGAA